MTAAEDRAGSSHVHFVPIVAPLLGSGNTELPAVQPTSAGRQNEAAMLVVPFPPAHSSTLAKDTADSLFMSEPSLNRREDGRSVPTQAQPAQISLTHFMTSLHDR